MRVVFHFWVLWLIFGWAASPTIFAASVQGDLDQAVIHSLYTEGEFEAAEANLLAFQKNHGSYSRSDSLFIAKHLSVIYAANPDTREKGKYHMYQLLALDPNAKLVDMIISDEIDRVFTKVKEEFATRRPVSTPSQAMPSVAPGKESTATAQPSVEKDSAMVSKNASAASGATPKVASKKSGNGWWLWSLAGAGVLAAGTTAYFALAEPSEKTGADVVYPVDSKAKAP